MKHTEGPCKIVSDCHFSGWLDIYQENGRLPLASTRHENFQANAKLIAAAPDLLAELNGVVGFFNLDTYKEGTPEFDYCQRIKKAIDKATK